MSDPKKSATKATNRVDWDDPLLASLLKKTESWQLDNRGTFAAQHVEVQLGWGAGSARPATLVWEREKVTVLETDFPIEQGMLVRIDKHVAGNQVTTLGTLLESRPGVRAHDQLGDVHVHWVSLR